MYQSGLLVLTSPIRCVVDHIGNYFAILSKTVRSKLYVTLEPGREKLCPPFKRSPCDLGTIARFLPSVYLKASAACRGLDVRVLLAPWKNLRVTDPTFSSLEVIFTDSSDTDSNVQKYVREEFGSFCPSIVRLEKTKSIVEEVSNGPVFETYDTVVLGGTFDRLHNGHKVLLSYAVLRAKKRIVVGVTDGDMLRRKILWEMIEPVDRRIEVVKDFLEDIDPSLEYSVIPIYDVFGPTLIEPDIDCIVVSEETKKGGALINREREAKKMKKLDMVVISLVEEPFQEVGDEAKVSSSNRRRMLLGTYVRHPEAYFKQQRPLSIAVIGQLQNHKDLLTGELKALGAPVIDCYDIVESLLTPSSHLLKKLVDAIGKEIKNDGHLDRNALDVSILKEKCRRRAITTEIFSEVMPVIEKKLKEMNVPFVIVNLPAFADNTWISGFDQVWGLLVPESEQCEQLKRHYRISGDDEAVAISSSILSNSDIVNKAHIVFCHQGDSVFLKKQVCVKYVMSAIHSELSSGRSGFQLISGLISDISTPGSKSHPKVQRAWDNLHTYLASIQKNRKH